MIKHIETALFCLLSLALFLTAAFYSLEQIRINKTKSFAGSDFRSIWQEGQRVCLLENPYSRFNSGEKKAKYKPPTYLPGFYLFACGLQKITARQADQHFAIGWIYVNAAVYLLCGLLIFVAFLKIDQAALALILTGFFWFSRWTLHTTGNLQTNLIAILPLLLALLFVNSQKPKLLLFSLSLCLKQLAIFALPVLVLSGIRQHMLKQQPRQILSRLFFVLIIPVLITMPFLLDDFSGVLSSLTHSADRVSRNVTVMSLEVKGLLLKAGLVLVYLAVYRGMITEKLAVLISFLLFCGLHRVFFSQYYLWISVFVIIYIHEQAKQRLTGQTENNEQASLAEPAKAKHV